MTAPPVLQPCGTIGAFQRHKRRGESPCDACRAAHAAWHRAYRAANPDRNNWYKRTRWTALESLARRFPSQYQQELYAARVRDPQPQAVS